MPGAFRAVHRRHPRFRRREGASLGGAEPPNCASGAASAQAGGAEESTTFRSRGCAVLWIQIPSGFAAAYPRSYKAALREAAIPVAQSGRFEEVEHGGFRLVSIQP